MTLRSFIYIDEETVDDYLSQIEGGILEGPFTEESISADSKGGGFNVGIHPFGAKANIDKSASYKTTQTIREMPASKFQRLYDALAKSKELHTYESLSTSAYSAIGRNEIAEFICSAQLPSWEKLLDQVEDIARLGEALKGWSVDNDQVDNMLKQAESIKKVSPDSENLLLLAKVFASPDFAVFTKLRREYLKRDKKQLEGEITIFGKVVRKLTAGKKVDALRLVPRIDEINKLNRATRRQAEKKSTKVPDSKTEYDVQIKYPAIEVTPVAIYR